MRGRKGRGAWPMGINVRGRVGWCTWPRGPQCERESRLGQQCVREKRLGRLGYGKQCERERRLGHPPWEHSVKRRGGGAPGPKGLSLRGRVGWGTWLQGTQPERESRLGHLAPGESM